MESSRRGQARTAKRGVRYIRLPGHNALEVLEALLRHLLPPPRREVLVQVSQPETCSVGVPAPRLRYRRATGSCKPVALAGCLRLGGERSGFLCCLWPIRHKQQASDLACADRDGFSPPAHRCSMIMMQLRPSGRNRASVVQGKTSTSRWEMQVQGLPGALTTVPSPYGEGTVFSPAVPGRPNQPQPVNCSTRRSGSVKPSAVRSCPTGLPVPVCAVRRVSISSRASGPGSGVWSATWARTARAWSTGAASFASGGRQTFPALNRRAISALGATSLAPADPRRSLQ